MKRRKHIKKKRPRKPMTLDTIEMKARRDLFKTRWNEHKKTFIAQHQVAAKTNRDERMSISLGIYLDLCRHELMSMKGYRIDYEECFDSYLLETGTLYSSPTISPELKQLYAPIIKYLIESKTNINNGLKQWRENQEKRIKQ